MSEKPIYYINGKFVSKNKAKISIMDLGLLRGFGVFDYMVTYHNKPFMLGAHLQRLKKSAKEIGIALPWSLEFLKNLIYKLIKKNKKLPGVEIRIIVTGGESPDGISAAKKPTLAILVNKRKKYKRSFYKNGAKLITVTNGRQIPLAKTLNYINAVRFLKSAKQQNAQEAVYVNKKTKEVYEATTSNVFLVKNGSIFTPSANILPGVTRKIVLSICRKFFPTKTAKITLNELKGADEVFITATNKEVLPIVLVDNKKVGDGKVGEVTKKIMSEYRQLINQG